MEGAGISPDPLLAQFQTNKGLVEGLWGKPACKGTVAICVICTGNWPRKRLTYLNKFLLSTDYQSQFEQLDWVGGRLSNQRNVLCPFCAGCKNQTAFRLWRTVEVSSLEDIPPILRAVTSWVPIHRSLLTAEADRLKKAAPAHGELCENGKGHGELVAWTSAEPDVAPASPPQPPEPPRASTGPTSRTAERVGTETGPETLADVKKLLADVKQQLEADFKHEFDVFRRSAVLTVLKAHFDALQSSSSGWEARTHDLEQQIERLRGEVQTLHSEVNTLRDSRCSCEPAPLR
jgi:hypothetical protein